MNTTRIRILNWDKYNAKRADVKKPSWHREENKSGQSPSLFGVPAAERYIFNCLKGLAGDEQSDAVEFEPEWFCVVRGGGCFTLAELDNALRLLNGRVLEVIEHEPSTLRARNVNVTLRDETVRDEESIAALAFSPPPPPEKIQSSSVPTEADQSALDPGTPTNSADISMRADDVSIMETIPANAQPAVERIVFITDDDETIPTTDPELRGWLHSLGFSRRGWDRWLGAYAGGDPVRLEGFLRDAHCIAETNPDVLTPTKLSQTRKARAAVWIANRLEIDRERHASRPAPPPGGADVIPLSSTKAMTSEELAAREECERRKAEDAKKQAAFDALSPEEKRRQVRESIRAGMAEHDKRKGKM